MRSRRSASSISTCRPPPSGSGAPSAARVRAEWLAFVVCVVVAQPIPWLIAPFGGAIEPLVHAPQAVQPAGVCRIRVVDDAVFERERAHARPLPHVARHVSAGHRGALERSL